MDCESIFKSYLVKNLYFANLIVLQWIMPYAKLDPASCVVSHIF